MKTYDTSTWVMRHYVESVPFDKAFEPLLTHDQTKKTKEWLLFLCDQGMIPISKKTRSDWLNWRKKLQKAELDQFLTNLKQEFVGPNIDIFFLPLNKRHEKIMTDLGGKNGSTFSKFILLFWHDELPIKDQKALLLHEYHHAARLLHQNENERTIVLLESMIMEGLAEWEVGQRLGDSYLAPWTKLFTEGELRYWWTMLFKDRIGLKGRAYHQDFLYGGRNGIPPWIGYQLGYEIVKYYATEHDQEDSLALLKKPAKQLVSVFMNK